MQDDPRRQLDAFADGPRHDQPASTVLDGHPNSNQPLTESNLDRHTRIHPPDARDTVAWYLRGLQGGTGTSTSATNVQAPAKQQVSQTLECHRIPVNRSEVELQAGCEKPIDPKGSPSKYPTAEEPVLSLQAIPSGLSGAKLVEARRLLVASIRSKHDPLEQVTRKSAPPASTGSTQSSTKQLLPRPQDLPKNTSNDRENVYEKASAVDQSQDRIEARRKSKRKLSDPGVVVGRRPKPRSKIAHSPTEPVQAGHDNLTAVQKAKEDHRRLLDQRRERRRARAIIVKDRSKITAPSDTVVKANKKARKENDALGPSKYRTATDAVDRHAKVKHTKRRKGNRRRSESTSSMSDNDTDHKAIKYQITSTKRSTDVQRNVAALKEASKGKRPGNKTAKYDPLERAANILPAGRVTLKAKTGIYNHGQASSKHATGQNPAPKKLTDLSFSELSFLNQPIAESSRLKSLQKAESNAYRETTVIPRDSYASAARVRGSGPSRSDGSESERNLPSRNMQSRPRRPKRRNVEMPVLRRKSKGFASLKKMEIETAHPPEQQNTGQRLHRMQGLALETRELSSATSNEASVQATHNTTPTASRIVSTVPGSGQPLSSLTGLSAGSLARRRLLRRMDRVAEILEPRSTTDNLQQELHAFRSTDSITRQGHGPSAKYGSAQIAAKSTRAAPDLPRGIDKYSPTALSTTRHSYSLSKVHPINRSPDWFASHEAYTSGFYTHAHDGQDTQSALRSFGNASVPVHNVHADQAANLHARYEDAIPNYGLPVDTAEYRSTPQGAHYANVELGNGTPGTSRYPNHMTSLSPGCGPGDHAGQPAQDAYCFDQNIPMSTLQWELVERRPLQYSVPEAISYASEAHLQMNNRDVGRIDAEPFPMSLPYAPFAEDSARFQRGRADLFSYGPYPSSPPRLQPLRGFWQRNYL